MAHFTYTYTTLLAGCSSTPQHPLPLGSNEVCRPGGSLAVAPIVYCRTWQP